MDPAAVSTNPTSSNTTPPQIPLGTLIFCIVLVLIGCGLLVITVRRLLFPPEPRAVQMQTYDLAEEAKRLVRKDKPAPLSQPLEQILEEGKRIHFDSQPHPLLGKAAPEFSRPDVDGNLWVLKEHLKKGPVVIVFYLGYYCNHCVSQLFDLNEDLARFRELGAEVVALSPDSAETTRTRYQQYGRFDFPLLFDRNSHIAEAYGVYTPKKDDQPEDLLHGTFIVDQQGIVRWAAKGNTPFGHNATLLYELAKLRHD